MKSFKVEYILNKHLESAKLTDLNILVKSIHPHVFRHYGECYQLVSDCA